MVNPTDVKCVSAEKYDHIIHNIRQQNARVTPALLLLPNEKQKLFLRYSLDFVRDPRMDNLVFLIELLTLVKV